MFSSSLYSEILVQAAGVDFFQIVAHAVQVGFVVFARFDGVDRFDTGADFTGQGFRRLRADHVFHENRPHVVGPAIVGQAGQLAGTGLAAGKDGFDAVLGQAEVAAEVGKGCMACDEILAGDAGEFAGIFILQGLELLFVVPGIVAVIVGVGRIGFSQGGGDIGNFYLAFTRLNQMCGS